MFASHLFCTAVQYDDQPPDLTKLLYPSAVAVIGASSNPKSISGQPLAHMLAAGYKGALYPVNPNRSEVQGLPAFGDVREVSKPIDVAVITVPAANVPIAIEQCGEAGIPYAVVFSSGFSDMATDSGASREAELRRAIKKSRVRVVGPNCVGVMNVTNRAYLAFGGGASDKSLKPGPMAVISQSGGFGQSIMTFANLQGIGSNYVVSCGNETDLNLFDFAHDFLERKEVKLLAIYMEACIEGLRLRALGEHALRVNKPILILKVGNSGVSRKAASSHTRRLTADYTLFRAAFEEGGYIEVHDLDELTDVAQLVVGGRHPKGRRVGILTGSGGWGVIMAEQCERNNLVVPTLSDVSKSRLKALGVPLASAANPVDLMANYSDQHRVLEILLDDPAIDQLLVRSVAGPEVGIWAQRFMETAGKSEKPVAVMWASIPTRDVATRESIEAAGYFCSNYPGRAARALARFAEFALKAQRIKNLAGVMNTRLLPRQELQVSALSRLTEHESRCCLARYGIPSTREIVMSLDEIQQLSECPLEFPVAVKIVSADIPHKTEANAVRLGITNVPELKLAANSVYEATRAYVPTANIAGISIQEMATGFELILGAVNDRYFGPYVIVGCGGILAELLDDVAHRFAPVSIPEALEMLAELRCFAILEGYRGAPRTDVKAIAEAIHRISLMILDHRDKISEIDINPLFVKREGQGVVAADALIVPAHSA